ncbi:MAG: DUF5343 domain-containing protein [Candidatus Aegiribacteria sp.]|nr:DUF5343 domain-containing protein [Candidatus Aegiribacteria sp.]
MEFPILHDPGSIELLLNTVYKSNPPKVVDHDYLIGLGFKREVDEGLLKLLLFLGFIDDNGQPSVLWDKSRDPEQAPIILGKAVKAAYGSLFAEYSNAEDQEGAALMEFFRNNTSSSDPDAAYMILTFKVLCDLSELPAGDFIQKPPKPVKKAPVFTEPDSSPVIRISINIDLDDKSDPDLRNLAMKLLKKQLEL